jgi:hypothetical protein
MASRPAAPVRTVSVTIDGATHLGTYYLQIAILFVHSPLGAKASRLGGSPPELMARLLLAELVRGSEAFD